MAILKPHPFLHIKRISLRVWSLRKQIESLVQKYLESQNESDDIKLKDYKEILKLYDEEWLLREYFDLPQFKKDGPELPPPPDDPLVALDPSLAADEKRNEELFELLHKVRPEANAIGRGHTFLSDIDIFSINFFSTIPFIIGQSLLIEFKVPRQFIMSGEVLRCINYNRQSRVISDVRPEFRVQARFSFRRIGEKTLLRNFLASIHVNEPGKRKGKEAPKADQGGDDGPSAEDIAALGL